MADKTISFGDSGTNELIEKDDGSFAIRNTNTGNEVVIDDGSLSANGPLYHTDAVTGDVIGNWTATSDNVYPATDGESYALRWQPNTDLPDLHSAALAIGEPGGIMLFRDGNYYEMLKLFGSDAVSLANEIDGGALNLESEDGGGIRIATGIPGDKRPRIGVDDPTGREKSTDEVLQRDIAWFDALERVNFHTNRMRLMDGFKGTSPSVVQEWWLNGARDAAMQTTGNGRPFIFQTGGSDRLELGADGISHHQNKSNGVVWETDNTANRPSDPQQGQRVFDTDLGQPIWFDGSQWVDAMGGAV